MRRVSYCLCLLLWACTVELPERRLSCSTDADCPSDWACLEQLCTRAAVRSPSDAGDDAQAQTLPPTLDAGDSGSAPTSDVDAGGGTDSGTIIRASDCTAGQGWDPITQNCYACQLVPQCNDRDGETGNRIALRPERDTDCICETKPDYYILAQGGAVPCDQDGDGWVVDEAQAAVENQDARIRANARCRVLRVQRVVLYNELLQPFVAEDFSTQFAVPERAIPAGLPLYESRRNDGTGAALPTYNAKRAERRFAAAELNSLTKACGDSTEGDFNDNGVPDFKEHTKSALQLPDTRAGLRAYYEQYLRFSYFLELHDGWYATLDQLASYNIGEKTRLLGTAHPVPLLYPENSEGSPKYAQTCTRHPDAAYLQAAADALPQLATDNTTGADFVEYSTGANAARWHGMTHHSQYKCTLVTTGAAYATANERSDPQLVYTNQTPDVLLRRDSAGMEHVYPWTTNDCALDPEGSSLPAYGPARNPKWPGLTCQVSQPAVGRVQWSVVRLEPYTQAYVDAKQRGDYKRGCADACLETTAITTRQDCKTCKPSSLGSATVVADPSDPPSDDGNPCTSELCDGTLPTHQADTGTACGAGVCQNGVCTSCIDGDTQCTPDRIGLQTCMNGAWLTTQPCTGSVCNARSCGVCTPSALQCTADRTGNQSCTETGTWGAETTCASGVCTGAGDCGECTPQTQRCTSEGAATCDDTGHWGPSTACEFGCAANSCRLCAATDKCCTGAEIGCGGTCIRGCCDGLETICINQPSCFAAGTLVTMADGSEQAIERVQVGEHVLAYDPSSQQLVAAAVTGRLVHPSTESLVVLNGSLVTTPEHRFFVAGEWLPAERLAPGTQLTQLQAGRTTLATQPVSSTEARRGPITTYNLEIAGAHDYFAGGFLVHNVKITPISPE